MSKLEAGVQASPIPDINGCNPVPILVKGKQNAQSAGLALATEGNSTARPTDKERLAHFATARVKRIDAEKPTIARSLAGATPETGLRKVASRRSAKDRIRLLVKHMLQEAVQRLVGRRILN